MLGLGDHNYVNVALYLQNASSKTLDNPNLKYVVQTVGGTTYALTADSLSTSYQILPQESKTLNLIAKIPKSVNLNNLQLLFVQNDETLKSDIPVASLSLGTKKGESTKTAVNKEKILKIDSNNIATRIESISRNQSFGKSDLSVQFALVNKGDKTITVPNYSFEIQTGSKSYPLVASGLDGLSLEPGDEQMISVDGTLPVIANAEEMDLILKTTTGSSPDKTTTSAVSTNSYPIAVYSLPEYTEMQHAVGQERVIKNNDGVYGVTRQCSKASMERWQLVIY